MADANPVDRFYVNISVFGIELHGRSAQLASAATAVATVTGVYYLWTVQDPKLFVEAICGAVTAITGAYVVRLGRSSLLVTVVAETAEIAQRVKDACESGVLLSEINEVVRKYANENQDDVGQFESIQIASQEKVTTTTEDLREMKENADQNLQLIIQNGLEQAKSIELFRASETCKKRTVTTTTTEEVTTTKTEEKIKISLLEQSRREKFKAVHILKKKDGKMQLEVEKLEQVLKPADDMLVAIISICGDKRKGKSFLLNLLLRYLTKMEYKHNDELEEVFEWKGGKNKITEGIWILNKPLMFSSPSGKLAVYLMDTQGMFDNQGTKKEFAQIFALNTLMGSFIVANYMQQLLSTDIEHLELWTDIATWTEEKSSVKPFQDLLFLIRDFSYPDEGLGFEGGKNYLSTVFDTSDTNAKEINHSINKLKNAFDNVSAFAMPQPNQPVRSRSQKATSIRIGEIGGEFLEFSEQLFEHIKANVRPHNLLGHPSTGKEIFQFIINCSKILLGKELMNPRSMTEMFSKMQLQSLVDIEFTGYIADMQKSHASLHELETNHKKFSSLACNNFDKAKKIGCEASIQEQRNVLTARMKEKFKAKFDLLKLQIESEAKIAQAAKREKEIIKQIEEMEKIAKRKEEAMQKAERDMVHQKRDFENQKLEEDKKMALILKQHHDIIGQMEEEKMKKDREIELARINLKNEKEKMSKIEDKHSAEWKQMSKNLENQQQKISDMEKENRKRDEEAKEQREAEEQRFEDAHAEQIKINEELSKALLKQVSELQATLEADRASKLQSDKQIKELNQARLKEARVREEVQNNLMDQIQRLLENQDIIAKENADLKRQLQEKICSIL